jgi:hypothetical protein
VKVFAHVGIPFFNNNRALRMTFTNPVAFVGLDFIASVFNEGAIFRIYDAAGVLLDELTPPPAGTDTPISLSFTRPGADIKYAVAFGTGPFIRLDNLRFDPAPAQVAAVPEPGTLALCVSLGVSLAGAALGRRARAAA